MKLTYLKEFIINSIKKGAIINLHKLKDETKYNLEVLFNSKKPKENISSSFLFYYKHYRA